MSDSSEIPSEDIDLFRKAVGAVAPIKQDRFHTVSRKPKPIPVQRQVDEQAVMAELASVAYHPDTIETGDGLQFKRAGLQNRQFQKLRKGQFRVEAELDLHGMTIALAQEALSHFLGGMRSKGRSCVRIIHGKGRGSKDGRPVLKVKLQRWLQQRDDVLAYCSARPADGGTGAVYVLLKKSR